MYIRLFLTCYTLDMRREEFMYKYNYYGNVLMRVQNKLKEN